MSEKETSGQNNILEFFHNIKEYLLVFAMLLAVVPYINHYIEEIGKPAKEIATSHEQPYVYWIVYGIIIIIILFSLIFNLLPKIRKNKELNLRPTGEADQEYFTTSPRLDDKYNFFSSGYEHYINWLRSPQAPILYLTGSSGSGKSSLINAYIAPRLKNERNPKTSVFIVRAYHDPLKELYEALRLEDENLHEVTADAVYEAINKASKLLAFNEQILIILDQFEEFFLLRNSPLDLQQGEDLKGLAELKLFFYQFLENAPKGVHILLSYRDDFQQLIDQLELPARTEHINYEQVKLLTFERSAKFLKGCPGLQIPEQQLDRILREASSIDTPIALRPIVLNLLGIILQRMVSQHSLLTKNGNLIRQYILDCLGKELKEERAIVLKAMLTDFHTAQPRTIAELSKNSKLNISQLDNQMLAMQHSGLVRCLDTRETSQGKRKWQIAHDFVALQLEKVVHGVRNTFWQKGRPWLAPSLLTFLILFTYSFDKNKINRENEFAIKNIEHYHLFWNNETKSVKGSDLALDDGAFASLLTSLAVLKPDSLDLKFKADSTSKYNRVPSLEKLSNLKNLVLINNVKAKNLNHLAGLQQLNKLDLTGGLNIEKFDEISTFKSLTLLTLEACTGLEDLDFLRKINRIKKLNLNFCTKLKNIDGIETLDSLNDLNLGLTWKLKDFSPIKKLKNLETLKLVNCIITNIDFLSGLQKLTFLDISSCPNLHVGALKNLTTLKELWAGSNDAIKDLHDFKNLKPLSFLNLDACTNLQNIEDIREMKNLIDLNLARCEKLKNLNPLSSLSDLVSLELSGCLALTDISGLRDLKKLKELNLTQCDHIKDVSCLFELTSLELLNISQCKRINKQQVLELKKKLPKLKILGMDF